MSQQESIYIKRPYYDNIKSRDLSGDPTTEAAFAAFYSKSAAPFYRAPANGAATMLGGGGPITVTSSFPVAGDGSGGTPLTFSTVGAIAGNAHQYNGASWSPFRRSLESIMIFVDVNGDDATAEINNPMRPYAALASAKAAAVNYVTATGGTITVYVRPGTYNVLQNLMAQNVYYYFEAHSVISCFTTAFSWTIADPVITNFAVYGEAEFFCTTGRIIQLSNNVQNMFIECRSIVSTVNDAIFVDVVTNIVIIAYESIISSVGIALRLRTGTGFIISSAIRGATGGVLCSNANGTWRISCREISSTLGNAISMGNSSQNLFVMCNTVKSNSVAAITCTAGNVDVNCQTITGTNSEAVRITGGVTDIFGADSILGNAASGGVLANGGTLVLSCGNIFGIRSTSGSAVVRGQVSLVCTGSATVSAIDISGTSNVIIEMDVNRFEAVHERAVFTIAGTGAAETRLYCNYITAFGSSPVANISAASCIFRITSQKLLAANAVAFVCTGGTMNLNVNRMTGISANALVQVSAGSLQLSGLVWENVGNVLSITAGAPTVEYYVSNSTSSAAAVFSLATDGGPTLNIYECRLVCLFNNAAGNAITITTGVGTPTIRIFDTATFVTTNAGAAAITSAAGLTNILVLGTINLTTAAAGITFLVGVVNVNAAIV